MINVTLWWILNAQERSKCGLSHDDVMASVPVVDNTKLTVDSKKRIVTQSECSHSTISECGNYALCFSIACKADGTFETAGGGVMTSSGVACSNHHPPSWILLKVKSYSRALLRSARWKALGEVGYDRYGVCSRRRVGLKDIRVTRFVEVGLWGDVDDVILLPTQAPHDRGARAAPKLALQRR